MYLSNYIKFKFEMLLKKHIGIKVRKIVGKYYFASCKRAIRKKCAIKGKYGILPLISDNSLDNFKSVKKYNDSFLCNKLKSKSQIKIGFVTYTSTTWNVGYLFDLIRQDSRFKVELIIGHRQAWKKYTCKEYSETISYFSKLGYPIKEADKMISAKDYDILFFLSPFPLLEKSINYFCVPLSTMILHTSYSYMLVDNSNKVGIWMYHLAYKYYTDSQFYKFKIENHALYTGNAEFFGFPKMDHFYLADTTKKIDKIIIIYAPHHSVDCVQFKSSTFDLNYMKFIELAKKYEQSTYWIYKPHPRLRDTSVRAGIFKDVSEYDDYMDLWRNLPNSEVVTSGDYFSTFLDSDAMITDSVSFLAEYQFTHKPLLLLQSGKEQYNEFGNSIVDILYKCSGDDYNSIENFIESCINNVDPMFEVRKEFFEKNLDYLSKGEMANKRIYDQIISLIG